MDASIERFDFRMSLMEHEQLAELSKYFHRNRADTVRLLIREVHRILELAPVRLELPVEIADALRDGRLKVNDLAAETLGLGNLNQYDLSQFAEKTTSER